MKRNLAKRHFLARATFTALFSCALVAAPVAANATEQPEPAYVLAAWKINTPGFDGATVADVWGGEGQTLAASIETDSTDLTQLNKGHLACGAWYQIDLYNNDSATASLLAGARLYGPSNPQESPATGVSPWYVSYWTPGACAEKPEPRAYFDSEELFSCEVWTYRTKTGFYDLTFDEVANVWTENKEPTITQETSQTNSTTYEERQAYGCAPELAQTGVNSNAWLFAGVGLLLLVAGASLVTYRNRQKGAHRG